jgi:inosose dehydratase
MTRRTLLAALAASNPARPFAFSAKGYPNWPLERAFAFSAQLGYTGIELLAPIKFDPAEIRALAKKHRLPVVAIMEDLRLTGDAAQHLARLETTLKLAAKIGHPVVETVVGGLPPEWEKLKPQFAERLAPWARLAEKYKVPIAIKAHIGSALHLPEDAALLCRQLASPYLKINYDYSHFQLQKLDLETTLRAALPHIAMIHIKDSTGAPPAHRFLLPGEGSIDYTAYAALLNRLNYRGPIVVEVSAHVLAKPNYDPEAAARQVAATVLPKFK